MSDNLLDTVTTLKFSQFSSVASLDTQHQVVGYDSVSNTNVRISKTDLFTQIAALVAGLTLNAATLAGQNGAYYLARSNHTGTQLASTISDFAATTRATVLTGYASTTGTITAADTVLSAINKLNGNTQNLSRVNSLNSKTGALTLAGTANQVDVNNSGPTTISLSLPQNIDGTAVPGFAGIYLSDKDTTNQIAGDINLSAADKVHKLFRTLKDIGTWQWQIQVGNENGVDFSGIRLGSIDWEPTTIGFTGFWVKQDNAYVAGQSGAFKGLEYILNDGTPYTNEFDATLTDASLINRLYADNRYAMASSLSGYAQLAVANTFTALNTFQDEIIAESALGHAINIRDKATDPHGYLQFLSPSDVQKAYIGFPAPSSTELTIRNNSGDLVYSASVANSHRFGFDGSDIFTLTTGAAGLGTKLLMPGVDGANYGALQVTTTNTGDATDWVAATFGGSEVSSQPKVIMGSLNGFATLAAHRYDMLAYRPLVLNGIGDLSNSGNEVWIPNQLRVSYISSFNSLGYITFGDIPRCSVPPTNNDDLVNKAYIDPLTLPAWMTPISTGTGPNRYLQIENSYNFACTMGMLIKTGVYDNGVPGFTRARWWLGLNQTSVNDDDGCGIGQDGVGLYLSCFRRNQVGAGLGLTFEGRYDGTVNRDDVRFLVDSRAMIKGTVAEWFFYRTDNPSGAKNASIRLNDSGALVFGGYNDTWAAVSYTQTLLINVLSNTITANGQIHADNSITVGQSFSSATLGTLRSTPAGELLFYDGASWRTVTLV